MSLSFIEFSIFNAASRSLSHAFLLYNRRSSKIIRSFVCTSPYWLNICMFIVWGYMWLTGNELLTGGARQMRQICNTHSANLLLSKWQIRCDLYDNVQYFIMKRMFLGMFIEEITGWDHSIRGMPSSPSKSHNKAMSLKPCSDLYLGVPTCMCGLFRVSAALQLWLLIFRIPQTDWQIFVSVVPFNKLYGPVVPQM